MTLAKYFTDVTFKRSFLQKKFSHNDSNYNEVFSHGFNGQTVVFDPDNDCTEKAVTLINVDLESSQ